MPSEALLCNLATNRTVKLGELHPGFPPASMTDMSDNARAILSLVCRADDSGTDVYRFTWGSGDEIGDFRVIPAEWYTPENIIHSVEAGEEWEHRMTTKNRSLAKLLIKHVSTEMSPPTVTN